MNHVANELQRDKNPNLNHPKNSSETNQETDPTQWVDLYGNRLYRYAMLQSRDGQLAEDFVQETFVKAVSAIKSFRGEGRVEAWLFQILRNVIAGHYRKQKTQKNRTFESSDEHTTLGLDQLIKCRTSDLPFSCSLEREEFWTHIRQCYDLVPPHLLETFLIRLANPKQSIENLCDYAGISVSNFSVRLFRTRVLLRKCLENKL